MIKLFVYAKYKFQIYQKIFKQLNMLSVILSPHLHKNNINLHLIKDLLLI